MLSRVAERLYWFARYIERAENTARLLLVNHQLTLDLPEKNQPDWIYVVDVLGSREAFAETKLKSTERNVVSFVFGDREHSSSIFSSISAGRDNIRTSREVMPREIWEYTNSIFLSMSHRINKALPRSQRHKALSNIIGACQKIVGLIEGTMSRDEVLQFIRLGRAIERADMSTRIIDVSRATLGGDSEEIKPYRNLIWVSILYSQSAYQMYRLDVRRNVAPDEALNFLLRKKQFPRSVISNLVSIRDCIKKLPRQKAALEEVADCIHFVEDLDVSGVAGENLKILIDELQIKLATVHNRISHTWFFSHD